MTDPLAADRAANLQSLWPTLSSRERDALVAKARGERFKPDNKVMRYAEWLKPYTTEWSYAGPLLEELVRVGFTLEFGRGKDGDGFWLDVASSNGISTVLGSTLPDVIGLAYCLWKGVEP